MQYSASELVAGLVVLCTGWLDGGSRGCTVITLSDVAR